MIYLSNLSLGVSLAVYGLIINWLLHSRPHCSDLAVDVPSYVGVKATSTSDLIIH